jgi:hypothetical protein
MPGYAYSIPASTCIRGAVLREIPGSVCFGCYAFKHRYTWNSVQQAMWERYVSLEHPQWVEAMVFMIRHAGEPYFRWHDSGDLQSVEHLQNIIQIAYELPEVKFWLPTRELGIIKQAKDIPPNLIIRYSDQMIGKQTKNSWPLKSGVSPKSFKRAWNQLVRENNSKYWHCPAHLQDNKCGSCRACWDTGVKYISYLEH